MIAHLQAVQALLEPTDLDVFLIEAVKYDVGGEQVPLAYPYYLLWPSTGTPGVDESVQDVGDTSRLVGVTAVGENPTSAGIAAHRARLLLGEHAPVALAVAGRSASVRWAAFGTADVDRQVTLPGSNRHPAFQVEMYRIESTPA